MNCKTVVLRFLVKKKKLQHSFVINYTILCIMKSLFIPSFFDRLSILVNKVHTFPFRFGNGNIDDLQRQFSSLHLRLVTTDKLI